MFRLLISTFSVLCFVISVHAQSLRPSAELTALHSVEKVVLPIKDNASLMAKELKERRKGRPNTFAVAEIQDIKPSTHGSWESTKSGNDVWRLVIQSQGAQSLNLGFDLFRLPESAQLFIYDFDKKIILPPFSAKDNDDHMQLWTPAIEGDQLVLELQIDPKEIEDLQLRLKYINHDFEGIIQASASGSCNVDVMCGAADGYPEVDENRDIIQSSASYSINGVQTCSGALINNTRNDGKPYFLTADHCGISEGNSPSVVVYWNYMNSYCRLPGSIESGQNGDGERIEFNSGATFRAAYEPSDFLLIEMDDPLNTDHNLFLSGWNRAAEDFSGGIAIHHPGVEEKRISFEDDPLVYMHPDLPNINQNDTTMIIVDDWDLGTTEGGSSGSPLYNKEKQLLGQLYGGLAACGNDRYDRYGWLGHSWEGGGTPSTQLKVWLDPDDFGVTELQGLSGAVTLVSTNNNFNICTLNDDIAVVKFEPNGFENDIQLSIIDQPDDIVTEFSLNPLPIDQELDLTISNLSALTAGVYTIKLLADDVENQSEITVRFEVFDALSTPPILNFPEDGEEDLSSTIEFKWEEKNVISSDFEISDVEDFSTVLLTQNDIEDNSFNIDFLDEDKTYYWHVKNRNFCGESDWSDTYSFTVGIQKCFTHKLVENIPADISTDIDEIDFPFSLDYDCNISDINILKFQGVHSYIADLFVTLSNDDQTTILLNNVCGSEDDFDLGFDDIGIAQIPCPPIDGQLYQPEESLRSFNDNNLAGDWNFKVEDTEFFDGGQVQEIVLQYCFTKVNDTSIIPLNNYYEVCGNGTVEIPFYYYDLSISELSVNFNGVANFTTDPSDPNLATLSLSDLDMAGLNPGLNELQFGSPTVAVASIYIFIHEDQLAQANLVFPEPNSTVPVNSVTSLLWDEIPGIENYFVELSDDQNFNNIIVSDNTDSNQLDIFVSLDPQTVYYVRITANNICGEGTTEFQFTTGGPTSIKYAEVVVNIYPNPADKFMTIDSYNIIESANLYDTNGSIILQVKPFSESWKIDTQDFPEGIYFLQLNSSENSITQKIAVQHGK